MARPSVAPRNLSLTEELEKLEQSITLTLQEIDHNFSKAHRIVTTSILPLVEQYGENSRAVWEASKFWKQFFEASANVSLSGYEELENDGESTTAADESTALRGDTTADYHARPEDDDATATPGPSTRSAMEGEDSMLDEGELTGSTPRRPVTKAMADDQMSHLESPYEAMQREMKGEEADETTVLGANNGNAEEDEDSTVLFAQRTARLPDMHLSPERLIEKQQAGQRGGKDPLLHRVLDKNYRLQTTPHKPSASARRSPQKDSSAHAGRHHHLQQQQRRWDDSPMSSPEMAVPTLRSEAFMSPFKSNARQRLAAATGKGGDGGAPRTPGVSVQTPGGGGTARKTRDVFGAGTGGGDGRSKGGEAAQKDEIDCDSDDGDDLYAGMSPPKTIQFALPPSKLLQTPAREASKRIVDDILQDAGAESSEYSPTMVKMNEDILNDSF